MVSVYDTMTNSVTICIGTFGGEEWRIMAVERAIPSALAQGVEVIHVHGETLAQARNEAIARASGDLIVTLDADDELEAGYVDAMLAGTADIRAPRLVEVGPDGSRTEVRLADRDIEHINPAPVSAMARRDLILSAGGFQPWPAWEDWALWLTLVRRGATVEHIPGATLFAHVSAGSRNRTVSDPAGLHAAIREASR